MADRRELAASARLARISAQLVPGTGKELLSFSPCKGLSKYERLHGNVSSQSVLWQSCSVEGPALEEVIYEKAEGEGITKITINRPHRRNAFTPQTITELQRAFTAARDDEQTGVVILTGQGVEAFCSGGDQAVRGKHGYVGKDNVSRLNVLDLQIQIRRLPKPVIAMVAGYAVGGGHVLHMICDITIAADNAVFGQTGPKVGSFDAGYGSSMMARLVGQKKAREMWFLARFYDAQEALTMGLINAVVPLAELETETVKWCRQILQNSPTAIRVLKSALNAVEDGHAGLQVFSSLTIAAELNSGYMQELGGNATLLFYNSEEGDEGRKSYMEGRQPNFSKVPRLP